MTHENTIYYTIVCTKNVPLISGGFPNVFSPAEFKNQGYFIENVFC